MYTSGTIHQTHPVLLCSSQVNYTRLTRYYYVHLRYNTPDSPCIVCTPQVHNTRLTPYYYVPLRYNTPASPCIILYTSGGTKHQTHPVLLCTPPIYFTRFTLYHFVHLRQDKPLDSSCIIMYTTCTLFQTNPVLKCTPQVQYTRLTLYYFVYLRWYNTPDSPCMYTSDTIYFKHSYTGIVPQRTILQFSSLRNMSMWSMLSVLQRIIKDIRINQHIVYHNIQYASCKHYIWGEIFNIQVNLDKSKLQKYQSGFRW